MAKRPTKAKALTAKQQESVRTAIDAMAIISMGLDIYSRMRAMTPDERQAVLDRMKDLRDATRSKGDTP